MVSKEDNKHIKMKSIFLNWNQLKRYGGLLFLLLILYLIWTLLRTPSEPVISTGPLPKHPKQGWIYADNSQGITEEGLSELLKKIEADEEIRPLSQHDAKTQTQLKPPKLHNTYKSSGSLTFERRTFYLDGKQLKLMSGAMHYFRVMPNVWRHRMQQMKACGLNTLETYVPWNLHEEYPGEFNFEGILDIRKYIQMAKEEGLYVLFRPGPYICSEWDFGGLPAWLLKDKDMKVRSNYPGYMSAVEHYFAKLIPLVKDLQYKNGGPIIGVQVENEFGSYSSEVAHLQFLKRLMLKHGITEMLFTSDGMVNSTTSGYEVAPFYDEALPTANFKEYQKGQNLFKALEDISADFPLVVMEFWSGWFDHWDKPHAYSTTKTMAGDLQKILKRGASVNFYMFHGGTNFGFTAGANWFNTTTYKPDITSYDYIAPLSEAGDVTPKYEVARAMIKKYVLKPAGLPTPPEPIPDLHKASYGTMRIDSYLPFENILNAVKRVTLADPVSMEMLAIHNGYGQNFGYITYRAYIQKGKQLTFTSLPQDYTQIRLNNVPLTIKNWYSTLSPVSFPASKQADMNILDIFVENHGRVNYVKEGFNVFNEGRKGINSPVLLDKDPIKEWSIYPLDFKKPFVDKVSESSGWKIFANWEGTCSLFRGKLQIIGTPFDTFVNMKGWGKGIVLINGFNLGRYWNVGPQKTLYVPASVLKPGDNQVLIFEQLKPSHSVEFQSTHILE